MNKISACLVIYNEEKYIKRCLESVNGVVDEIIVVHDGECKDKTLEICTQFTDKIFIRKHVGVAEPHRPLSFRESTGDWILWIDADEFLSAELKKELKRLVDQDDIDGYSFRWKFFDIAKNSYCQNMKSYKAALFRKSKIYFLGIPHYGLKSRGKVVNCELILNHIYKHEKIRNYFAKFDKWAKIQASLLVKNFDEIESFQANKNDWENANSGIKKYGRMSLIPLIFPVKFFVNIIRSKDTIKTAFLSALYSILLTYYYSKEKKKILK